MEKDIKYNITKSRLQILKLYKEERKCIQALLNRDVLVRGTVYSMAGKCGKSCCKCYKTDYSHKVYRIIKSVKGKPIARVISKQDLDKLRILTQNYKKFKANKNVLKQLQREIIKKVEELEKSKSIEYYGKGKFKTK